MVIENKAKVIQSLYGYGTGTTNNGTETANLSPSAVVNKLTDVIKDEKSKESDSSKRHVKLQKTEDVFK